jgi:glycosyltransferase involved in cell wall biosynthesis
MKVLFVHMQYGRSYLQGTERYLSMLGRCLRERGHRVAVLAGDPLRLDRRRRLGERVWGRASGPPCEFEEIFALPSRGWLSVQGIGPARLARWLAQWRPDVVHVANPAHIGIGVTVACRRLGIPLVVTTMDFWWVCPKSTLLRPDGSVCEGKREWPECIRCLVGSRPEAGVRALAGLPEQAAGLILAAFYARALPRGMRPSDVLRWTRRNAILSDVLSGADEVIFPSRATWEAIRPSMAHDRCRIIPYGLSPEWFASPRVPAGSPRAPEELVLGYAGAMLPHKAPHLLLEGVRQLGWKKTRIRLAGPIDQSGGGYAARLREAAEGLNAEFVGSVPASEMPGFLRGLDVLAMTSVWPENLPFVVLEAQAGGVPVVASRLAGVADQVGDERLLFAPGSAKELAAALAFVAEHPGEVHLGPVSTVEEMAARTEAVYADAVKRR